MTTPVAKVNPCRGGNKKSTPWTLFICGVLEEIVHGSMGALKLVCLGSLMCFLTIAEAWREPRPTAVWIEPLSETKDVTRPKTWDEKNYGQICRNFTTNRYTQCPQGSFIHWYTCCGVDNTECCFGIQTWAIVCFGSCIFVGLLVLAYTLLLHFNLICLAEEDTKYLTVDKVIESAS